jgi:hypothetical protein
MTLGYIRAGKDVSQKMATYKIRCFDDVFIACFPADQRKTTITASQFDGALPTPRLVSTLKFRQTGQV